MNRIMEINGIRLTAAIEGRGRPVILLHGFPDSSIVWRNQAAFLSKNGFRVIAPDLRGFGESDAPAGRKNYTIDIITDDIVKMMDLLEINSAPVVGHDWGAVIGWNLAINQPARVERYVALSVGHPASYRSDFEQKFRSWYALWFQVPFLSELSVRAFEWRLLKFLGRNHPETQRWIRDLSRQGRLTSGLNWYRANFLRLLFHEFPPVKVPVLGIWSDGDIFLSEGQMKKSAAHVTGPWRYERIEGSSHWIPLDAPDRLNSLVRDYLVNDGKDGGSKDSFARHHERV